MSLTQPHCSRVKSSESFMRLQCEEGHCLLCAWATPSPATSGRRSCGCAVAPRQHWTRREGGFPLRRSLPLLLSQGVGMGQMRKAALRWISSVSLTTLYFQEISRYLARPCRACNLLICVRALNLSAEYLHRCKTLFFGHQPQAKHRVLSYWPLFSLLHDWHFKPCSEAFSRYAGQLVPFGCMGGE